MAYPGPGSPPVRVPKDGSQSRNKCTPGGKCSSEEFLGMTEPTAKVGPAPTSRLYTRDYSKKGRDPDQTDLVTTALGNPFRL